LSTVWEPLIYRVFTADDMHEAYPRTLPQKTQRPSTWHRAVVVVIDTRWTDRCLARAGRVIKSTIPPVARPPRPTLQTSERIIHSSFDGRRTFTSAYNALFLTPQ